MSYFPCVLRAVFLYLYCVLFTFTISISKFATFIYLWYKWRIIRKNFSFSGVCSMEQPACWTWVKPMKVLEIGDQLNVLQEGDKHLTDYHTHLCYCHLRWLFSLFIFFLGVLPLPFVFLWHDFPAGQDHSLKLLLYFHLILCKEQWRVWTVLVSVHVIEDAMGSWDCETRPKGHLGTVKFLLCALKSCSSCISSLVLPPPDC